MMESVSKCLTTDLSSHLFSKYKEHIDIVVVQISRYLFYFQSSQKYRALVTVPGLSLV